MSGGQLRPLLEIPCNPEVTHKDIDKYVNYCEHDCKNCRHIMQKARMTVTKASKSRRENFEICCYGDHISLCFWSGSRGNEVVIQMDEEKIQHDETRSAWREWLRQAWKRFKERFRTRQRLEGEERTALEHN